MGANFGISKLLRQKQDQSHSYDVYSHGTWSWLLENLKLSIYRYYGDLNMMGYTGLHKRTYLWVIK